MQTKSQLKTPPGQPTQKIRKGQRGEVYIYANWCKGCRICVEFCPTGVLDFDEEKHIPVIAAPEKCTGCHFCDTHYPDLAIVVKRL